MMNPTRIGLFDDHHIVRAGFRFLLADQEDILIEAEGSSGQEALEAIRRCHLDVCLLDLSMPDLSGMDVLRQARMLKPELSILIMSAHAEEQYGLNVLKAGAAGFLSKELASDQLLDAVRTVANGHRYVSPKLGERLADGLTRKDDLPAHLRLSERELQIFMHLAQGERVNQIGAKLYLSPKTVSTYRMRLLNKLGLNGNAELARYAVTHGLLS